MWGSDIDKLSEAQSNIYIYSVILVSINILAYVSHLKNEF